MINNCNGVSPCQSDALRQN